MRRVQSVYNCLDVKVEVVLSRVFFCGWTIKQHIVGSSTQIFFIAFTS